MALRKALKERFGPAHLSDRLVLVDWCLYGGLGLQSDTHDLEDINHDPAGALCAFLALSMFMWPLNLTTGSL
jgi:hypothetical protein